MHVNIIKDTIYNYIRLIYILHYNHIHFINIHITIILIHIIKNTIYNHKVNLISFLIVIFSLFLKNNNHIHFINIHI